MMVETPGSRGVFGPVLVLGFGVALAVWCAAFLAHLPWIDLPGHVAGPAVLVVWTIAAIVAGRATPRGRAALVGALSGFLTALVCLLILGSALVEQPEGGAPAPGARGLPPSVLGYVPAFLALGAAIGLIGALIGSRLRTQDTGHAPDSSLIAHRSSLPPDWLFRFSILTAAAILALLVLGGAVTSTDSGMAIRGWPASDAANMFLYPISLMADPQRFLEHSHRLFGTFVGLCSIVLLIYTCFAERRFMVKAAAAILLGAVIAQGVVGGMRVIDDDRIKGLFHGIGGQAIFAFAAAIAAMLSPTHRQGPDPVPHGAARGLRRLTTALLVCIVLQVAFGAAFRHLKLVSKGADHALYTHIAFSIVVVLLAIITGFKTAAAARNTASPILRRTGMSLVHTVGLQFLLGWAAFAAVMLSPVRDRAAAPSDGGEIETPAFEAIVATAHQAVGALLFALAALAWVWTRRLLTTKGT